MKKKLNKDYKGGTISLKRIKELYLLVKNLNQSSPTHFWDKNGMHKIPKSRKNHNALRPNINPQLDKHKSNKN